MPRIGRYQYLHFPSLRFRERFSSPTLGHGYFRRMTSSFCKVVF
jgi:hypothetical protein